MRINKWLIFSHLSVDFNQLKRSSLACCSKNRGSDAEKENRFVRVKLQAARSWELGNAAINRLLWSPQGFALVGWGDVAHLSNEALDEGTA